MKYNTYTKRKREKKQQQPTEIAYETDQISELSEKYNIVNMFTGL